jgi:hypothetical protein
MWLLFDVIEIVSTGMAVGIYWCLHMWRSCDTLFTNTLVLLPHECSSNQSYLPQVR